MKLYKSLLYFTAALTAAGAMTGCSEEATLDGADAVYLELQPTDIYLRLGDTVKVSPRVTNVNGEEIPTQVALSVDDETVAKILGDTAVVAVNGGQGKGTKLRATLVNGKYAVTNVNVIKNTPLGLYPINEIGDAVSSVKSWGVPHAMVDFAVNPIELLDDYSVEDGTIAATLEGLKPCTIVDESYNGELITVDRKHGIVTVHFTSPKVAGTGKVKLTIGEGGTAMSATMEVVMQPAFQFASFYGETAGPDIAAMPYLNGRPSLGTLTMYIASKCDKVIDINSEDEVRVAMNIEGGTEENILEAVKCYKWNMTQGGALLTVRDDYEIVAGHGFDAVLGVRSGVQTGTVVYECETPCVTTEDPDHTLTLTLTYNVVNIKKDYPIRDIILDNDNVSLDMNATHVVHMSVEPMASYAYQKVNVEVADPTIVKLMDFEGYDLPIQGLKPGTTTVKFSAYNDTQLVEKIMTVTVNDPIGRVVIDNNSGATYIFAGGSTTWKANAYTISGVLMSNVDLSWESSNTSVATVNNGVIAGVAEGNASITATSGGIVSGGRTVYVRKAPDAIGDASGFQGFYEDGDDIVFLDNEDGYLYIPGGYASGSFEGTYTLSGAYYMANDAQAPATGTVTIAKGAGEYEYIVTMNVNINLSSSKVVRFAFNNGTIEYLPE